MIITKETLDKSHERRLELCKKSGNEIPKRLFIDGKFNPHNWNGGDDYIREFLNEVDYGTKSYEFYNNEICIDGELVLNKFAVENTTHVFMVVKYNVYGDNLEIEKEDIEEVYYITWHKDRGRIDLFKMCDKEITQEDYIRLLNIISNC